MATHIWSINPSVHVHATAQSILLSLEGFVTVLGIAMLFDTCAARIRLGMSYMYMYILDSGIFKQLSIKNDIF